MHNMARLYFLGGEDLAKRDSEQVDKKAFADAGGAPTALVFIGWASESAAKTEKYRGLILDYFRELGAKETVLAELSDSLKTIEEKMGKAGLVYLPGGNTRLLVERINKKGLGDLLRRYDKVILGNSAGALALCKECLIIGDETQETTIIPGVGAIDFSVCVHYNSSKDKELLELSKGRRIYAIAEGSALVHDERGVSSFGLVHMFYRGKKTQCL